MGFILRRWAEHELVVGKRLQEWVLARRRSRSLRLAQGGSFWQFVVLKWQP